ncbi:hypothetical protein O9929_23195 [Vibrio lentus]|nr:hypothetical protein [Vibrio lentus]
MNDADPDALQAYIVQEGTTLWLEVLLLSIMESYLHKQNHSS